MVFHGAKVAWSSASFSMTTGTMELACVSTSLPTRCLSCVRQW
jgi:hypothetical protein